LALLKTFDVMMGADAPIPPVMMNGRHIRRTLCVLLPSHPRGIRCPEGRPPWPKSRRSGEKSRGFFDSPRGGINFVFDKNTPYWSILL